MTKLSQWFGQLTLPLWIVLACGIMAGAMVAQQVRPSRAAAPTPPPAALAAPAAVAPGPEEPARPAGITFLDSPKGTAAAPATGSTGPQQGAQAEPARASGGGFERIVIMMLVLAGGATALYIWRKKKDGGAARAHAELSVIGQVRVGGRWSVALVKVPGKTLVLGATDKGLSLLSTIGEDDIPGATDEEREEELEEVRSFEPARPYAERPPRPPLPTPSTEPFGRLLDQLAKADREHGPNTKPDTRFPPGAASAAAGGRAVGAGGAIDPLREPIRDRDAAAYRERLKTPEANALRARLERYQTPGQPGAGTS